MPLDSKILGVGLSRTGTTSLTRALQILGIAAIHYPNDDVTIDEVLAGGHPRTTLAVFQAATDTPIAICFEALDRSYPGSKFILTVRDERDWLRSMAKHMASTRPEGRQRDYVRYLRWRAYGSEEFDRAVFADAFELHRRKVVSFFADRPDDLLVIDITAGDGWDVLCPFLGLPDPLEPFPHANKSGERLAWFDKTEVARFEISLVTPDDAVIAIVDQDLLNIRGLGDRRTVPFPERDGYHGGIPKNDEDAIRELQRHRERGVEFVAFCWPAFWWLQYFDGLRRELHRTCMEVARSEHVVVYDLRESSDRPAATPNERRALRTGDQAND